MVNIISPFSSQYPFMFFKSSRSSAVLLSTPFSCHLSFNGIMKKAITSWNMTNPIGFYMQDNIYKCPFLAYRLENLFIRYFL